MEATVPFSELYSKDPYSTSLKFCFLNYVLKTWKKPQNSDCNEACKPQKDLPSDCLLSTVSPVYQISSDTA